MATGFFAPPHSLHRLLTARLKLEKEEGKDAHDPNVSLPFDCFTCSANYCSKLSTDMKKLNKKFAKLHGYSSLVNLVAFLALVFHGLWIGTYGISG